MRTRFSKTSWQPLALSALGGLILGIAGSKAYQQFIPRDRTVRKPISPAFFVDEDQFLRSMGSVLRAPLIPGNSVQTLINGAQIFPEMLSAIGSAQQTINFETFVYWSGEVGRAFAEALSARARAGVQCRVLLDWYGSYSLDRRSLHRMRTAGVRVDRFHRNWWRLDRLNHRTHRKLLIIDGKIGFIGGVGIADQWSGNAEDNCHWRDNHYKVEGPVVAQLQSAFADNWLKSQHEILSDRSHFPLLEKCGSLMCQAYQSSPDEGSESMRLMVLLALSSARRSVRIATAYFVPDKLTISALTETQRRGVNVEIIVPGPHIDHHIVRRASRNRWGALLEGGITIYEYLPTMYHCKAIIVDERWVSIGSANFDNRSFSLNDEANLNILDEEFAQAQAAWFDSDKERCRLVSLGRWRNRPLVSRAADSAADVAGTQF